MEENWTNLLAGKSGIVSLKGDDEFKGLKSQIGGRLPSYFKLQPHYLKVSIKIKGFSLILSQWLWLMP